MQGWFRKKGLKVIVLGQRVDSSLKSEKRREGAWNRNRKTWTRINLRKEGK